MPWSVSLRGPKYIVLKELNDMIKVAEEAFEAVKSADPGGGTLSLQVSGDVSWDEEGILSSSTHQTVHFNRCKQPEASRPVAAAPKEQKWLDT